MNHPARRFVPLVWGASALSSLVLVLGVNGTLSSWTAAIITNSTDTVATANALILQETGPGSVTCFSSSGAGNSFTCSTINKYGGTSTPLTPGASQTVDVTFTNVGGATGASFTLAGGACSQTPTAGSGAPPATNLCTAAGELTVGVSCSNGSVYNGGAAWTDLVYAPGTPSGIGTLVHTAGLAPAASWTCRFTVALSASASVADQGITVSQPLTWTLA